MGKLIVIEGTDGSGKSTQFKKLWEHLEADGVTFKHIVFAFSFFATLSVALRIMFPKPFLRCSLPTNTLDK